MDELVKTVSQQTGLPEAQARQAAEVVIKFIKDKLPAPVASQVDSLLGNGGVKGVDNLLNQGKGFFGRRK